MILNTALLFSCVSPGAVRSPEPVAKTLVELQEEVLPAVALIYGQDDEGNLHYGTGLLLEEPGQILTNWHVVEPQNQVVVLLHDANRTTYTALDGGVVRLIRESGGAARAAEVVQTDIINDLALLELEVTPSAWTGTLVLREDPVLSGEAVWAVGHPAENVWSFTRGVVSAVHRGAVQHDAAVNIGNSGGPLLDMQGRVIGINTLELIRASGRVVDGISYARPMSLAAPLYDDEATFDMDLSSPEASLRSFWMAVELGREEAIEAIDLTSHLALLRDGWLEVRRIWIAEDLRGALQDVAETLERPELTEHYQGAAAATNEYYTQQHSSAEFGASYEVLVRKELSEMIRGQFRGMEDYKSDLTSEINDLSESEHLETLGEESAVELKSAMEKFVPGMFLAWKDLPWAWDLACGLTADPENPHRLTELLKLGMAINAVRYSDTGDSAWVMTSGVNKSGVPFECSTLMRREGEFWRQDSQPRVVDLESLPEDFPAVTSTLESRQAQWVETVGPGLREFESTLFRAGMIAGIQASQGD